MVFEWKSNWKSSITWNPFDWKIDKVLWGIVTIEKNPFDEEMECDVSMRLPISDIDPFPNIR